MSEASSSELSNEVFVRTPRKRRPSSNLTCSPSKMSSITSIVSELEVSSLSSSITSGRESRSSSLQILEDSELPSQDVENEINIEDIIRKFKKLNVQKAKDYALFKPKKKNQVYGILLTTSEDEQNLADSWLKLCFESSNIAVPIIFQLITETMGYTDYTPHTSYNKDNSEESIKNIVQYLETHPPRSHYNFKCLLNSKSVLKEYFLSRLTTYFYHIVRQFYNHEGAADLVAMNEICVFLKELVCSQRRMIRLSSAIILIKLCTAYYLANSKLENILEGVDSEEHLHAVVTKRQQLMEPILTYLRYYFIKYCYVDDDHLQDMRLLAAKEIKYWLWIDHKRFLNAKYFNFLKLLVEDAMPTVRLAAMETCITLADYNKFIPDEEKRAFLTLCTTASGRLLDIKPDITALAVKFCTRLQGWPFINEEVFYSIVRRVCSSSETVVKESRLFIKEYIKSRDYREELTAVLELVDHIPKKYMSLYVEAMLGQPDDCLGVGKILSILKKPSGLDFAQERQLLEVIYHLSKYLVTGLGDIPRYPRPEMDFAKNNDDICGQFVPALPSLIIKYGNEYSHFQWILKTILLLEYQERCFRMYRHEMQEILKLLINILGKSTGSEIITLISKIFMKIADCDTAFQPYVILLDKYIITKIEEYEELLFQTREIITTEQSDILCEQLDVIYLVSENYNINVNLKWNNIFDDWHLRTITLRLSIQQMKICANYLAWEFEAVDKIEPPPRELIGQVQIYLKTCLEILYLDNEFRFSVYECMCEVLKKMPENVFFDIQDIGKVEDALAKFVNRWCFEISTGDLSQKRKYLMLFITLSLVGRISSDLLWNVLQYYANFKQFKDIFDELIKKLMQYDINRTVATVLVTFAKILEGGPNQLERLKNLVYALSKTPLKNLAFKIYCAGVCNISNITLLTCLIPFSKNLRRKEKAEIIDLMRDRLQHCNYEEVDNIIQQLHAQEVSIPDPDEVVTSSSPVPGIEDVSSEEIE